MKIGAGMRLSPRENYLKKIRGFYHDDGTVKVITEVRRCGKFCLMQCVAEELKALNFQFLFCNLKAPEK